MLLTAANRMRRAGVVIGTRVSHHRPHRALASSASSTVEGGGEEALNHSCVLASRPGVGNNVELSNFSYRADPLPEALSEPSVLSPGQVVLKTKFLSVDPYMRCMFDEHHPQLGDYQRPFAVDEPLHGGGVGEVVVSSNEAYSPGDMVVVPFLGYEWRKYVLLDPSDSALKAFRISGTVQSDPSNAFLRARPSLALGALGMPGATAYVGLFGEGKPKKSDTVVVSGAAGGVGSVVGQLARLKGRCRSVVGICGSEAKCNAILAVGFDEALNYNDPEFAAKLLDACPRGIDVYFDNVGGDVSAAVLPLMQPGARVPICGQIASYNDNIAYDTLCSEDGVVDPNIRNLLRDRGVRRERFTVINYPHMFQEAAEAIGEFIAKDQLIALEAITEGFQPAEAYVSMMSGENIGKAIVRV